jgi:hypothetical protein
VPLEGFEDGALRGADPGRLLVLAELAQRGGQLDQQGASADQPVKGGALGVIGRFVAHCESLGEPGDHRSIDRVVFGQPPGRLGEVAHALGIDHAHRNPGGAQGRRPALLIAAARFHHRQPAAVGAQPGDQLAPALRGVLVRGLQPEAADAGCRAVLGDVDADNPARLCHAPVPFLARPGSEAQATVRVEGSTGPVPRSPAGLRLWWRRAQAQRRAVRHSRPFAYFAPFLSHKGASEARRRGLRTSRSDSIG